jgi:D-alanyl-lipoteichoic acid acyltransferase DltB (MBOAT superfamily)
MIDIATFFGQFLYDATQPMLFHHGIFLFLFANFLILYGLLHVKSTWQKALLITFSFYFYYKSSGNYLFLLLLTVCTDYLFSHLIVKAKNERTSKVLTFIAILFSLSFLLYFKYLDFFLQSFGLDGGTTAGQALILPIGISFYTFQSISYLVDIHRKKIQLPKLMDYLLYMSFFPHLVAGPIVRAKDFLPQLKKKIKVSKALLNEGFFLITKGFIKKAIVADFVAQYVDIIYASPKGISGVEASFAVLGYALQIFCDFSGYTDMAIGIALLMGYRLCLNFDSPYKATHITAFWRKWHISLSSWLRDFIYIPLGGNQKGFQLQLFFLMLTMTIGGLWHGADWKFVWWGVGHGLLLVLHKVYLKFVPPLVTDRQIWTFSSWLLTFVCVVLLWIPFRAQSLTDSFEILNAIGKGIDIQQLVVFCRLNWSFVLLLLFGFIMTLLPERLKQKIQQWYFKESYVVKFGLFVLLIQAMYEFQSAEIQPFIYFQF